MFEFHELICIILGNAFGEAKSWSIRMTVMTNLCIQRAYMHQLNSDKTQSSTPRAKALLLFIPDEGHSRCYPLSMHYCFKPCSFPFKQALIFLVEVTTAQCQI